MTAGSRSGGACGARLDTSRDSPDSHGGQATLMQFQARLLDLLHAKASATVLSSGAPARSSATLSSASMGVCAGVTLRPGRVGR